VGSFPFTPAGIVVPQDEPARCESCDEEYQSSAKLALVCNHCLAHAKHDAQWCMAKHLRSLGRKQRDHRTLANLTEEARNYKRLWEASELRIKDLEQQLHARTTE
jgi:predicted amidophosphoribosyltransferase